MSFLSTLVLLLVLISSAYQHGTLSSFIYSLSIPSYYYLIILLITVILTPLLFIKPIAAWIILPKVMLDSFLIADIFVFSIYRFHIDMLFIEMAIFDFKGIGLSWVSILFAAITFLAVITLHLFIFSKAKKNVQLTTKFANISIIILFIIGQAIHIWGNFTKQETILAYTPYLPFYAPITSTKKMAKLQKSYPQYIVISKYDNATLVDNKKSHGLFNYPLKPMTFDENKNQLNVLLFVVESWRSDMLTSNVTPYINEFAKTSHRFNNHYSGGNVTVSGLFSLMYGLNPSYLASAQSAPFKYQSQLTKSFAQQGYEIDAYTGSNLDRFSLKPMLFGDITDQHFINPTRGPREDKDQVVAAKVISDIESSDNKQPWFKFVFLVSSHWHYGYPEQYKIDTPIPKNPEGFLINKHIDAQPFINDYKNSLRYVDSLFKQIHQAVINSGQDKNTLIIVTSDHGEEFNDNKQGYWGHGSNFTKPQTAVPMLIYIPGQKNTVIESKRSAHVDVLPTLLKTVLNTSTELSDFSSGFDLFSLPKKRGVAISSYNQKAYLVDDTIYSSDLLSSKYNVNDLTKEPEKVNYQQLNKMRQQDSHFIK